jgi:hypothetical protein
MYVSYDLLSIILFCIKTIRQLSPMLHHRALKTLNSMKWCNSGDNVLFWLLLELHIYCY